MEHIEGIVAITARLRARPGMEDALARRLKQLAEACAHQEGLLLYCPCQSRDDPREFVFCEQFASEAAWRKHSDSQECASWREEKARYVESGEVRVWKPVARVGSMVGKA